MYNEYNPDSSHNNTDNTDNTDNNDSHIKEYDNFYESDNIEIYNRSILQKFKTVGNLEFL